MLKLVLSTINPYIPKWIPTYILGWKYRQLRRWLLNPPAQEYVLPMLFKSKPSIFLWLSRKFPSTDLTIYAQYFHPSFLIENTLRKGFFRYHAKLFPNANPPPWFDRRADKCELYQCSKIVETLLEAQNEITPYFSRTAPDIRLAQKGKGKDYDSEFEKMMQYGYSVLQLKYQRENPDLLPIAEKEMPHILARAKQTRDERRELEFLRKGKLYKRIEEMSKAGIHTDQINLFKMVLDESKDCYMFYQMFKDFLRMNQQAESKPMVEAFSKLGLDKMEPNDKSAMPPEEQFCMKFDELYQVALERLKVRVPEEAVPTQTIAANL